MDDTPMRDADILILCATEEAGGEPDDGKAAVVRVVLNRIARKYESDGTVAGTVFKHDQFSWTSWTMSAGKYVEVAKTPAEVMARAKTLLLADEAYGARWSHIAGIVAQVQAGTYHGPLYDHLTPDTVLYLNPVICTPPAWATPDKLVCIIGHHHFYRT